jgi:hypothetical protein
MTRIRATPGPDPPGSSRCRFERRKTPVPRVLLSITLAGPPPSGYWHVPALSGPLPALPGTTRVRLPSASTALLRQGVGEGLSPPLEPTAPHGAIKIPDRGCRSPTGAITAHRRPAGRPLGGARHRDGRVTRPRADHHGVGVAGPVEDLDKHEASQPTGSGCARSDALRQASSQSAS